MVRMDEINATLNPLSSRASRPDENKPDSRGHEQSEVAAGGTKELVLTWFVETQASLILHDGRFPTWFHGFISRQEAEDQLRDKTLGNFLIRLSEKAFGYILSYKGKDRCRHFVINQTKDSVFVVSGDCITHPSLLELIEHFTHTPIQPFGECLTVDREAEAVSDDLYDVIHGKSRVSSGVSVQALRSLWDQRADVTLRGPLLPPKGSNRRLPSFSSIDRNITQVVPPVLKKNLPLRNSLSATLTGRPLFHGLEPHSQSEELPCEMGTDEELAWGSGGSSSLNSHLPCHLEYQQTDCHQLLPDLEEGQSHGSHPAKPSPPPSPHASSAPPRSVSSSSLAVFKDEDNDQPVPGDPLHTTPTALQPNPLYQTSSGLCAGHNRHWGSYSYGEPGRFSEISSKPISDLETSDTTYQDIPEQQTNDTYEGLAESLQGGIPEINTYEDIPDRHSNTYATVEEVQPRQHTWGKKTHKWWKFLPEGKKK